MIEITIPGCGHLVLKHLVMDYNGTLAGDGLLLEGVKEELDILADRLHIHVLTADTFGKARSGLEGIPCKLTVLTEKKQDTAKLEYIKGLGPESTICIGNGRNDRLMLKGARLGIVVIQNEGAAVETMLAADVVCNCIVSALRLLTKPLRLRATLRS